jgi:endonuclease/exonuclease/phosphatase family metal-dependent hydrolase
MRYRTIVVLQGFCLAVLFLASCSLPFSCRIGEIDRLSVMTYNAQAFFDAQESGSEFSEYKGKKTSWSEEKYSVRLDRLREAILISGKSCEMGSERGPDIVVLQEIENLGVVQDLCNRMPHLNGYIYSAFIPPEKGVAFGTALISRYAVQKVRAHSVSGFGSGLRPLLEIELDIGGSPFTIFAAHWKAKSGDDPGLTAKIRAAQELLLMARIERLLRSSPDAPFIACGDFNQSRAEFTFLNAYGNCWDDWLMQNAVVGRPSGSYYYDGSWETIDNFFLGNSLFDEADWEFSSFSVVAQPPLINEEGFPERYEIWNGRGYSDHLPLVLILSKAKEKGW